MNNHYTGEVRPSGVNKEYRYLSTDIGFEHWEIKRFKDTGWNLVGVTANPDSASLQYIFARYTGE